jgi:hypothetical protein
MGARILAGEAVVEPLEVLLQCRLELSDLRDIQGGFLLI